MPLFRFCHLRIQADSERLFLERKQENPRYKKRCTFGLIFLERIVHGNLRSVGENPTRT